MTGPAITPVSASALVFVGDLAQPVLGADDAHHLVRVLRLRPGVAVVAADGAGSWRPCLLLEPPGLEPVGPVVAEGPRPPAVTVGFALTKGDKPDLVVQKLTEVGVDVIVPFVAARSVVRWDAAKRAAHGDRFRRIAREAAAQSRRCRLPLVHEPCTFAEAAALPGAVLADLPQVVSAEGGAPPIGPEHAVVLVGPEGGWDATERAAVAGRVTLGHGVLRAETAAIAAGVLLAAARHRTGVRMGRATPPEPPKGAPTAHSLDDR